MCGLRQFGPRCDVSVDTHDGRDAGVGRADQRHPVFDRAHGLHDQVLVGRRGFAEPGVVGHVDQQGRPAAHEVARQLGKHALVADQHAERPERQGEHGGPAARCEVADALDHLLHEEEQAVLKRHVLPERGQDHLVVVVDDRGLRRQQIRPVEQRHPAAPRPEGRAAEQDGRLGLLAQVEQPSAIRHVRLEEERHRGLGPHDQVDPVFGQPAGQLFVTGDGRLLIVRVPFAVLGDVPLRDTDVERMRGRQVGQLAAPPTPPARQTCQQHQQRQQQPAAAGSAARQHHEQDAVAEHHERRHSIHAGEFGELNQVQKAVLRIAQPDPRKADEEERADPFQPHP